LVQAQIMKNKWGMIYYVWCLDFLLLYSSRNLLLYSTNFYQADIGAAQTVWLLKHTFFMQMYD